MYPDWAIFVSNINMIFPQSVIHVIHAPSPTFQGQLIKKTLDL